MPISLDQIIQSTRGKVSDAKRSADVRELERRAELHVPRGFRRGVEESFSVEGTDSGGVPSGGVGART